MNINEEGSIVDLELNKERSSKKRQRRKVSLIQALVQKQKSNIDESRLSKYSKMEIVGVVRKFIMPSFICKSHKKISIVTGGNENWVVLQIFIFVI